MKRILPLLAVVATFSGLAVPSAAGAAPTVMHITIDEQFTGEFLAEACGYLGPVTIRVQGHAGAVEFSDPGRAPVLINPVHFLVTYRVDDAEVTVREIGGVVVRLTPEGLVQLSAGQTLLFTGAIKVNLDSGEVILEPQHSLDAQTAEVCALYTG